MMNALFFSRTGQLAGELLLQLRHRWGDATLTVLDSPDRAAKERIAYDLVFVDIEQASRCRLQVLRSVRQTWHAPVVAITGKSIDLEARVTALKLGAEEVWDEFPPDSGLFIARLEALLRIASREIHCHAGTLTLFPELQAVKIAGQPLLRLSPAEYEVIEVLAGNSQVVHHNALVKQMPSFPEIDDASLYEVIEQLRRKLASQPAIEIKAYPGPGYRLQQRAGCEDAC